MIDLFIFFIVLLVFFVYYYYSVVRLPVLSCSSKELKLFLNRSMPILSEKYWPTIWCYGPRAQTVLAHLCCADFYIPYEREMLDLEDGGRVALDWLHTKNMNDSNAPIILILPGYTGTSDVPYAKKFAINANESNFRCVVFNYRGLSGVELKTSRLYSANDTADLEQVVQRIRKRFPSAVLGACGVSMGSLILAHYLIKYSHLQEISVAMMNSTLFDIGIANDRFESGFDRFFNRNLVGHMQEVVSRFKHILDTENTPWDMTEVMKSRTIQEFDDRFTRKMFGYGSLYEYYKEINISDKMNEIKIPLLCLNAADDPSQPFEHVEDIDSPLFDNDHVAVLITAAGGHLSHLEGVWPFSQTTTYMHRVFVQFFSAMFQNDTYKHFLSTESSE